MKVLQYLPSSQFSVTVLSIAAAGGLIVGAQYVTRPQDTTAELSAAPETAALGDWEASLAEVQATAPGLPEAPSQDTVSTLLDAAKSSNYTDTAARSLLINLSAAQSQGMGGDIPTQEKLIADATNQVPPARAEKTYTAKDITTVADSKESEKSYGNQVMEILGRHTGATSQATLYAVSLATDNQDASALAPLPKIQLEYIALVNDLAGIPVPATLVPLHMQILNSLGTTAATFNDMKLVLSDPLRGLLGIKQYQLQLGAVGRVFTSVAKILSNNGILFSKDEPGAAWAVFTSP